ncbi:MAG: iron-containing alcohol dehydrogenase [Chloroflexi bacterium]|nr:iron-containing alcohol dehydrogenase [Chloroflexota bacterium]
MLPVRTFLMPAKILIGSGASEQVGEEAKKLGLKKSLIVTDKIMVRLNALAGIQRSLEKNGIGYTIFDGAAVEPTLEIVQAGLKSYRENQCDFLLAVGGGSPIDAAKAVSIMLTNPGSIENYMGAGKVPYAGVPLIAIPTTAGTGSEVTQVVIITDAARNVKMLISTPFVIPRVAIVDPLLTLSCPRGLTATIGLDALTHAVEAYVSLKAQPLTDIYCISAIKLISGNLRSAWADGNNVEAREKVMLGAFQAGIAFSNSSVALVHGMSRPIGAYFHVAHGASNAVLLKTIMEFSVTGNPARYAQIAQAMGEDISGKTDLEGARLAVKSVDQLTRDLQVPSMQELGMEKDKLEQFAPKMAEDAIISGSPANNPRQATKEEIIGLYKIAYQR